MNSADLEIEALRRAEAMFSAKAAEADRMCRELIRVYACDFRPLPWCDPADVWYPLPRGVTEVAGVPKPRRGYPPKDYRGPVAVHFDTLCRIANRKITA